MLKILINYIVLLCLAATILCTTSCNTNKKIPNEGPLNSYYYNKKLMIEKGLAKSTDNSLSDEYILLQKQYKKIFCQYLMENLDIAKYDKELADNALKFIPKPEKKQKIEQKFSSVGLKYIYLRNVIYIEKLTIEDLDLLRKSINSSEKDIFDKLNEMVKRTYLDVIAINKEEKNLKIIYDNDTVNKVPNNAIVFKISTYPEYNSAGEYVDDNNEKAKNKYIKDLKERMEKEFNGKLGNTPIFVIEDSRSPSENNWNKIS